MLMTETKDLLRESSTRSWEPYQTANPLTAQFSDGRSMNDDENRRDLLLLALQLQAQLLLQGGEMSGASSTAALASSEAPALRWSEKVYFTEYKPVRPVRLSTSPPAIPLMFLAN